MIRNVLLLALCSLTTFLYGQQNPEIPDSLKPYIGAIHFDSIGNEKPEVSFTQVGPNITQASLSWEGKAPVAQDDWRVTITPAFAPEMHWASHLSPSDTTIIAQHLFRAPAMIMASTDKGFAILPDIGLMANGSANPTTPWYMDMDATTNQLTLGMSQSNLIAHVLYSKKRGTVYPAGKIQFGFYIITGNDAESLSDPWRKIDSFYWRKFGAPLYAAGQPLERKDLSPYVKHTYEWAFDKWKKATWQEFELNGKKVGGITFIVNTSQSPDFTGEYTEREFRSIWNQAWFSSLRSASGLFRYARINKDTALMSYAEKTKELALAFPQHHGFFSGLIATEMGPAQINGHSLNRSKGWKTAYFGNSNRNPYSSDPRNAPYHILDMSYTASLMLDWYQELEKDPRLLKYTSSYADALLRLQDPQGFFPAWLTLDSLKPLPALAQSPETARSVAFLLKLYQITKIEKYRISALKAMRAVMDSIVPAGRWEDFETYWSCEVFGQDLVGRKIPRNDQYKQNTLSMYWTAEALLDCYKLEKDKKYLSTGRRVLDELLMYQAVWQPPYMYINTLGGFGVMNADGEWNDARQSLFAELIVDYGKTLDCTEYIQRGLAALRASFTMMYCPENEKTLQQWEKAWPFFGPKDYGFMMENYGHLGVTGPEGIGIGEFTIYDWGNGAAAEAYERMADHYGKEFLEGN